MGHFGDVPQANLLAWYGKTKSNTTKYAFTNKNKCSALQHKINTNKSSAVAEMGDRLATTAIDRKLGWGPCFFGELGPHLTQCGRGWGLSPCHVSLQGVILFVNRWQEVTSFFFPVQANYIVTVIQDVITTVETWMKNQKFLTKYDYILNMHKIVKYNNKL